MHHHPPADPASIIGGRPESQPYQLILVKVVPEKSRMGSHHVTASQQTGAGLLAPTCTAAPTAPIGKPVPRCPDGTSRVLWRPGMLARPACWSWLRTWSRVWERPVA